jgi:RimJ/RimL family protein N-acetyltransferase
LAGSVGPADTLRLRFRRMTDDDLAALAELHGDAAVMRWIGDPEPAAQVRSALRRWSWPADPALGVWAAESREGRFVGWFSLEPRDPGTGVLGYRLQ